jgi:phosphoenolpyruvate synthase/pyruvate phosphate dikinase
VNENDFSDPDPESVLVVRVWPGRVVLWPVTTPYEMLHPTGGRHQGPFLEAEGFEGVLQAIKSWEAALFSVEAVFYRELYGQKHSDIRTVLAVQQAGKCNISGQSSR